MKASDAGTDLPPPPESSSESQAAPPSRLTRNELVYGYVVTAELVTVAVLNVVVKGGKGAPVHPNTSLAALGVVVSVLAAPVLHFRHRTIAAFAVIIAALFVSLPKVPDRLSVIHAFALVFPLAYALIISQRQRRAVKQQLRSGGPSPRAAARRERSRPKKGGASAAPAAGPRSNARYTPPKARRGGRR